jgi:hypothetical protein
MDRGGAIRSDPGGGRRGVAWTTPPGGRAVAIAGPYRRVLTDWSGDDENALATLLHRLNQPMDSHLDPSQH